MNDLCRSGRRYWGSIAGLVLLSMFILAGCNRAAEKSAGGGILTPSVTKSQAGNWSQVPVAVRAYINGMLLQTETMQYRTYEGSRPSSCSGLTGSQYAVFSLVNPYTGNAAQCNSTPTAGDFDYAQGTGEVMTVKVYVQAPGGSVATDQYDSSVTFPSGTSSLPWNDDFYMFVFKIYDKQYEKFCDIYWRRPNSLSELLDSSMVPQASITDPRTGNAIILSDNSTPAAYKFYIDVSTGRFAAFDSSSNYEPQTESADEVFGKLGRASRYLTGASGISSGIYLDTSGDRPGGGE